MIIQENEQEPIHQTKDVNQLMFNIETKLSLLTQIQKHTFTQHHLNQDNTQKQSQAHQLQKNQPLHPIPQDPEPIDLPIQLFNQKIHSIINQKSPLKTKTPNHTNSNHYTNKFTIQNKKLQLNQLETATRNIEEIQKYPPIYSQHLQNQPYSNYPLIEKNSQHVREFSHNPTEPSMTQSMLESQTINQNSNSQSFSSSKIVNKFNQIQLNYIQKIKTLSFKLSFLQQKLAESQQEKTQILQSLETYKLLYSRKQQQIQKQIDKRLEDIKNKLIEKFAEECRLKYNEYITQLKETTNQLNDQRKKRKFYEQQNKVFRLQKDNYEQMYKSLAKKQKLWLQLDIDQTKNEILSNNSAIDLSAKIPHEIQQYSQIQKITPEDEPSTLINKENVIHNLRDHHRYFTSWEDKKGKQKLNVQKSNNSISKSKQKSYSKQKNPTSNNKNPNLSQRKKNQKCKVQNQSDSSKSSPIKNTNTNKKIHKKTSIGNEMTKQQLIPFLAKGIQQLKQRLKIK